MRRGWGEEGVGRGGESGEGSEGRVVRGGEGGYVPEPNRSQESRNVWGCVRWWWGWGWGWVGGGEVERGVSGSEPGLTNTHEYTHAIASGFRLVLFLRAPHSLPSTHMRTRTAYIHTHTRSDLLPFPPAGGLRPTQSACPAGSRSSGGPAGRGKGEGGVARLTRRGWSEGERVLQRWLEQRYRMHARLQTTGFQPIKAKGEG